jgi:hypothetical protein
MIRRTRPNLELLEGRDLLSALATSLTTNQSVYQPGQPIVMTFQETNVSSQPISVEDGPSIDGFTVTHAGQVVWRSNAGINPLFIRLDTLQPGQSLTLTANWDGIPTGASAPILGQFVISNDLNGSGATATVTITNSGPASTAPSDPKSGDPPPVSSAPDPTRKPVVSPGGGNTQTDPTGATSTPGSSSIALAIATDHSAYRRGHRVRMVLTVKNTGANPVALAPHSNGDGLTLFEGGTPVWHSAGRASGRGSLRLRPGESIKLRATWNGSPGLSSVTMVPGTYTIVAAEAGHTASSTIEIIG